MKDLQQNTGGPPAPRPLVLVVDDEEAVAAVLARGLAYAGMEVVTARSGQEALERLAERRFDAVLSDIHMPRLRGDEMQRIARQRDPELAVLLITAADETGLAVECLKEGVFDYLSKPFDLSDVVVRVKKALERRALIRENNNYRQTLEKRMAEQSERLRKTMQGSLEALIHALEAKDPTTHNHSARVAALATALAERVRPGDTVLAARVRVAALFHDIGKIGIPEALLHKQGELDEQEKSQVRKHPEIGASILRPLLDEETVAMVRHHHEHPSGSGYPDQLRGDAIPLGGRIIAVADAYDAMSSTRPYRPELSQPEVLKILADGAGQQWDVAVVRALLTLAAEGHLGEAAHAFAVPSDAATVAMLTTDEPLSRETTPQPPLGMLMPPRRLPTADAVPPSLPKSTRRVGTRPVLHATGHLDAAAIHHLRTDVETWLKRGEAQIVLDLSQSYALTPASAHCLYALDLQAKRAGSTLILRDVPETVHSQFRDAGLLRLLHFENSAVAV